jgi:hypothetical protein
MRDETLRIRRIERRRCARIFACRAAKEFYDVAVVLAFETAWPSSEVIVLLEEMSANQQFNRETEEIWNLKLSGTVPQVTVH